MRLSSVAALQSDREQVWSVDKKNTPLHVFILALDFLPMKKKIYL
jgi:hypothetical protein